MARGEALVSTKIDGEAIQFHFMGGSYQTKEHVQNTITFGHGIQRRMPKILLISSIF